MKSFLPLLLLALSQVVLIQADYTVIAPTDYTSTPHIQETLNFGGEHIIQLGVDRSVLPEDEYHITQINQIEQNLLANGVNYLFNVSIASEEGVQVAAVYAVYYRYRTGATKVVSYQYNYTFPNSVTGSEFSWEDYEFDTEGEHEHEHEHEHECEIEIPTEETEIPTEEEVELPTEEEIELPAEEVELPTEEIEIEIPSEEEGENPTEEVEVEIPSEEEGENPTEEVEVEIPTENEGEGETEIEIPTENEEEGEVEIEIPTENEEEGEVEFPNENEGEGEGEGEFEGEFPNGEDEEEWVCEEEEVILNPPTEEEEIEFPEPENELPVDEWPNEWVEVCEEEQGEAEFDILN